MPNYVDALKHIRRVSERALAERDGVFKEYDDTACGYAAVSGLMTAVMREITSEASSTLKVCGELYWSKFTKPDTIADVILTEAKELLGCAATWICVGDSGETDIGYELISAKGNFCFAVRLEGLMWRVYGLPINKCSQPLKNVKELIDD